MSKSDEVVPKSWEAKRKTVTLQTKSFALDLGMLRKVVAECDQRDMVDKSMVSFEGLQKSYIYVDEWTVKEITVREELVNDE